MPTPTDAALDAWIDTIAPRFPLRAWLLRRVCRRRFARVAVTAAVVNRG